MYPHHRNFKMRPPAVMAGGQHHLNDDYYPFVVGSVQCYTATHIKGLKGNLSETNKQISGVI